MIRVLFLLAGIIVLGVLLWQLGPAEILRATAQLGWHSLPILVCYGFYQALRAVAFKLSVLN
jgi:nucleoside recognition membrane protein YjiH